jgi:hypothetical protein
MKFLSENFELNKNKLLEHNTIPTFHFAFDPSDHVGTLICHNFMHIWSWSWSFNSFCFILVSHTDMIFSVLQTQVLSVSITQFFSLALNV